MINSNRIYIFSITLFKKTSLSTDNYLIISVLSTTFQFMIQ